jgi:hypothetical protein
MSVQSTGQVATIKKRRTAKPGGNGDVPDARHDPDVVRLVSGGD